MSWFNHRTFSDWIQCSPVRCGVVQYLSFTFNSQSHSSSLVSLPLSIFYSFLQQSLPLPPYCQYSPASSFIASYTTAWSDRQTDGWCNRTDAGLTAFMAHLVLFILFKFNTFYVHTFTALISIFHFCTLASRISRIVNKKKCHFTSFYVFFW